MKLEEEKVESKKKSSKNEPNNCNQEDITQGMFQDEALWEENVDQTLKAKKPKRAETPEIHVIRKVQGKETASFTFKGSFTINREKTKIENNILIEKEYHDVSRNHAKILLLAHGFYVQDEGSTNNIYIKIDPKSHILLFRDMEFRVGNSLLIIDKIEEEKIELTIKENFTLDLNEENKKYVGEYTHTVDLSRKKEIKFPSENKIKKFFKNDEEIKINQVSFCLLETGNFVFKPIIEAEYLFIFINLNLSKIMVKIEKCAGS